MSNELSPFASGLNLYYTSNGIACPVEWKDGKCLSGARYEAYRDIMLKTEVWYGRIVRNRLRYARYKIVKIYQPYFLNEEPKFELQEADHPRHILRSVYVKDVFSTEQRLVMGWSRRRLVETGEALKKFTNSLYNRSDYEFCGAFQIFIDEVERMVGDLRGMSRKLRSKRVKEETPCTHSD